MKLQGSRQHGIYAQLIWIKVQKQFSGGRVIVFSTNEVGAVYKENEVYPKLHNLYKNYLKIYHELRCKM